MEMIRPNTERIRAMTADAGCPYKGDRICTASLSSMAIDAYQKERWCCTDDFDTCPIFLSKVLRKR
ncbi:MAG: hypothetical protein ACOYVJ_03535 [Nitrospirota bacterium]